MMMKKISLFLFFSCVCSFYLKAQSCGQLLQDFQQVDIHKKWKIIEKRNEIVFQLTDTMGLTCDHLSPLRHNPKHNPNELNTYELSIKCQPNWSIKRYQNVLTKNRQLTDSIRNRIIEKCAENQWRGKITQNGVWRNPMIYTSVVDDWTSEEQSMIKQVIDLPDAIIGTCGIYCDATTSGILNLKQQSWLELLFKELTKKGLNFSSLYWRGENHICEYQMASRYEGRKTDMVFLHGYTWPIPPPKSESLFIQTSSGVSFQPTHEKIIRDTLKSFVKTINQKVKSSSTNTVIIHINSSTSKAQRIQEAEYVLSVLKSLGLKTKNIDIELDESENRPGIEPSFYVAESF